MVSDFLGLPRRLAGEEPSLSGIDFVWMLETGVESDFRGLPLLLTGEEPSASFNGTEVVCEIMRVDRLEVGELIEFSSCESPGSASTVTLIRQGEPSLPFGVVIVMLFEGDSFDDGANGSELGTFGDRDARGFASLRGAPKEASRFVGELVTRHKGSGDEDKDMTA